MFNFTPKAVIYFLVFLLFLMVQVGLQYTGKTFNREFAGFSDEAGHYITGLMVRDFIAGLDWSKPMDYAENYYIHYPKVALGHWPPVFYLVQAAWTLIFSPSNSSLMLLMSLLAAILALSVFHAVKREYGTFIGIGTGLLLITLPLIQRYSGMMMAEILLAFLSFWAALCFGRYLETDKFSWIIGFTTFAYLAIMTKGNGIALAIVPPLSLLFTKRFRLLTRWSFWLPLLTVTILCGPWYWFTLDMALAGLSPNFPSVDLTSQVILYYSKKIVMIMGIPLSLFTIIGFVGKIILPFHEGKVSGKWASAGALLISVWIFHILLPPGFERRHLIMAVPALLMFFAAGFISVALRLPLRQINGNLKIGMMVLFVSVIFISSIFEVPDKLYDGYGSVADHLLSKNEFKKSIFMIASDEKGEGAFISEIALRERRPDHVVLRASKVLAKSRWDGSKYELLHKTPEEVMGFLESIPVGIIVFDNSITALNKFAHNRLLIKTINKFSSRWDLMGSFPLFRGKTVHDDAVRVYRLIGHEKRKPGLICLDLSETLGRTLRKKLPR